MVSSDLVQSNADVLPVDPNGTSCYLPNGVHPPGFGTSAVSRGITLPHDCSVYGDYCLGET